MKFQATEKENIKRHESGFYYLQQGGLHALKTKDWSEALVRAQIKKAQLDDFPNQVAHTNKISHLFAIYLAERRQGDSRGGTIYEIELISKNHLLPYFGNKTLNQITSGLWKKYCKTKHCDLANHRKVFKGFLDWCADEDFLTGAPDISRIPGWQRRKRRIIKPDELVKIFTHAQGSLRLFLALALYNGLRRGEIMSLEWANVGQGFIRITKANNKRNRERSLPVNQTVMHLLQDRREASKGPWVFPNAKDARRPAYVSGLRTAWQTCLKKSGLDDITWHDFRATFEKYAHSKKGFTDTQIEKFADATMDVQKGIYVSMDYEDLKGLEDVVYIPELEKILEKSSDDKE